VPPLNIFLDDGGVITDKQRRTAEFGRLVGDCFVPLFGGTQQAWTRAHRALVDRLADPQSVSVLTAADFVGFYRAYQIRWVGGMCELLDLPTPPEEECLDLASRALAWITRRIRAPVLATLAIRSRSCRCTSTISFSSHFAFVKYMKLRGKWRTTLPIFSEHA
jgi:hypothetical protein